jgi:hypothetical protein
MKRKRPSYGLIELETGNSVGFFETEAGALAAVSDSIARYGEDSVTTLALARFVGDDVHSVAEGDDLVRRARATHPQEPLTELGDPTRASA